MNNEQAYINGFVKRANQYGLTSEEAFELFKRATAADAPMPAKIHSKPVLNSPTTPMVNPPVRQLGMSNNALNAAQAQMEQGVELNLVSR